MLGRVSTRKLESALGDRYIDVHCIDCAASRDVAQGLVIRRAAIHIRPPTGGR